METFKYPMQLWHPRYRKISLSVQQARPQDLRKNTQLKIEHTNEDSYVIHIAQFITQPLTRLLCLKYLATIYLFLPLSLGLKQ